MITYLFELSSITSIEAYFAAHPKIRYSNYFLFIYRLRNGIENERMLVVPEFLEQFHEVMYLKKQPVKGIENFRKISLGNVESAKSKALRRYAYIVSRNRDYSNITPKMNIFIHN